MYHLKQIPSDRIIKKTLRQILFGSNMHCPRCRSQQVVRYESRYRCRVCRQKFSLLSHTWLGEMKLLLPKFWLILWAFTQAVPVRQAMALTGLSEEAVRRW